MKLLISFFRLKNKLFRISISKALEKNFFGKLSLKLYKWISFGKINYKVLPLTWLDNVEKNENSLLRYGIESCTYSPRLLGSAQISKKIILPDINYHVFKKARVSAISSSIIINDERVIIERAAVPDQEIHHYGNGHIERHNQTDAVVCLSASSGLACGIFLGGNGSWNYYHWMLELLVKLEFISQLPTQLQGFPLLVSEQIFLTPSLKETLEIFTRFYGKSPNLIILKKECSYIVDDMVYINAANSLPFNLIENRQFKYAYSSMDDQSINYLRNTALEVVLKNKTSKVYGERIFLARKNVRRNYNQDEVFSCLENYGFKKVFMEDLSFSEQVKTMHNAKFIVGPTGAAWANLVFSDGSAKALCWMAEECSEFSAYSNIAKSVGVDLRYITYKAGARSSGEIYLKDYIIDIVSVEAGLKELGLELTLDLVS